MGWDANIPSTKFVGKLPLQSFNNLMGAIRERCNAAGVSIPASLNSDLTKFELLPSSWFSDFQSTMTTLIPLYVNHTDNSGNWDGQTAIPAWTESDILALCDTTTRIPIPNDHLKAADWNWQNYQMLNLMRWRSATFSWTYGDYLYAWKNEGYPGWGELAWPNAVADFQSKSWVSLSTFLYSIYESQNSGGYGGAFTYIMIARQKRHFNISNSFIFNAGTDVYLKFKVGQQEDYENVDYPTAQLNKQYLFDSISLSTGGSQSFTIGDNNNCGDWPGWGAQNGNSFDLSSITGVFKFTGAGGFSYKDW